ncbi:hypothetical protein KSP40_PGU013530 [Platanthera guangdongensis]|uniref:Uncharacterized protein n=1 Tax=Platanthera guangdongensis TaxID=2320717 RepID=A0ABR2MXT7_9ASPA
MSFQSFSPFPHYGIYVQDSMSSFLGPLQMTLWWGRTLALAPGSNLKELSHVSRRERSRQALDRRFSAQLSPSESQGLRIVSRKPKDVWAVRLAICTYLIDGKHFRPLDLDHRAAWPCIGKEPIAFGSSSIARGQQQAPAVQRAMCQGSSQLRDDLRRLDASAALAAARAQLAVTNAELAAARARLVESTALLERERARSEDLRRRLA